MRSFLDAKTMAKILREALAERTVELPHSAALEIVARQFGFTNWNILAAKIAGATPEASPPKIPEGWSPNLGFKAAEYRLGTDPALGAAFVETRFDRASGLEVTAPGFAGLTQNILADDYRNKKLRLSASLRTEDADTGTIWMRIERAPGFVLRFDNMMDRATDGALKGTVDWTRRSVVLDVPEHAVTIHFGFFLQGIGRVWARDFRLEIAGDEAQITGALASPKPMNLDFSS